MEAFERRRAAREEDRLHPETEDLLQLAEEDPLLLIEEDLVPPEEDLPHAEKRILLMKVMACIWKKDSLFLQKEKR